MFAYIVGEITDILPGRIILENNGIAYSIATSDQSMSHFHVGETCKVYTYLQVREDDLSLYGFHDKEEKDLFEELITVSTIGPKLALSILSTLSVDEIYQAIINSDIKTLSTVPGVGKKTASRLVLDLVDKVKKMGVQPGQAPGKEEEDLSGRPGVARQALINLGYSPQEVNQVLTKLDQTESLEDMIRQALRFLS